MYIDKGKTSAAHNAVKAMAAGEYLQMNLSIDRYLCIDIHT